MDPHAASREHQPVSQHAELLVVGAGPAGLAAAIAGARDGRRTVLVDENPLPPGLMGMDVPLLFGGRMDASASDAGRVLEHLVATTPALAEAFDLGVEVLLGTCAWGLYVPGGAMRSLPGPVVGLADESRSWLCGFDRLVVAAGARDLVLSFAGSELPGIVGANALHSLLTRYAAFAGRRLVVLGSGTLALSTALLALGHGLEVAAVVEARDAVQGPAALRERLEEAGVEMVTGHAIRAARGGVDGVEAAVLVGGGVEREIACDTVCLALGLVPNVELLDAAGAALAMRPERGGWVPVPGEAGGTSLPGVSVVGDCAGRDEEPFAYRMDWMRALVETGGLRVNACTCEEVTRGELLGVQPPRYLAHSSAPMAARGLTTLLADGPVNQDHIKRLTRAGMGPCQGRRCREQIALLLAMEAGIAPESVPLAGYRAPVRPLPLGLLAAPDEPASLRKGWDVWFGIKRQWTPYADIGTEREWLGDRGHL
jgi:thioredoxin reductase